jgi:hypothetical protein
MQQRLEDLFQIDMALSLEAVNVKHLMQETQVCQVSKCSGLELINCIVHLLPPIF